MKELFDLTGKTAIVTGGGRGLGKQIAEAYAEAGANVVLCSRKVEACESVSRRLQKENGVQTLALPCNIAEEKDVTRVVNATTEKFGRIDILVNNSGATWGAPFLEMPFDKWKKVIDVNINGTFMMSQKVAKEMVKLKSGKIINIASVAGLIGTPPNYLDAIGYSTSKGALIMFTKDLSVKLAPYHIQVNAIAPGFFPTKMSKGVLEMNGDHILQRTPAGRFGRDEDIKGAALFLASAASNYVIGHVLTVDGGTSAS